MRSTGRLGLLGLIVGVVITPLYAAANDEPQPIDKVKAAFVFKFAKFCEWPEDAAPTDDAFRIGIAASGSMVEALRQALKGKTINDLPIELVVSESPGALAECHIVFFGEDDEDRNEEILREVTKHPVLTIGDGSSFIEQGGIIHLFQQNNKLRFDIHLDVAKQANLKISSKVLDLATHVIGSASSIEDGR